MHEICIIIKSCKKLVEARNNIAGNPLFLLYIKGKECYNTSLGFEEICTAVLIIKVLSGRKHGSTYVYKPKLY